MANSILPAGSVRDAAKRLSASGNAMLCRRNDTVAGTQDAPE